MRDAPEAAPLLIADGAASGAVLACREGLSFWGGVDPATGRIIDAHHPDRGASVAGRILMMPASRGSCSGSGVLLELALAGRAPAALVFREAEEILTLGALVAERIFGCGLPVLRLGAAAYDALAAAGRAEIAGGRLTAPGGLSLVPTKADAGALALSDRDRALLDGAGGEAARIAMEILCRMAVAQGAGRLIDVTRGHIDGCILAHDANLIFAEKLARMGARVTIPTTINAISVDREGWRRQGVPEAFGARASRLADAYVRMGAEPTFTCAPYLLDGAPGAGEPVGWSESNAVIYANSVLGARTAKHPDYLDLFIALTGRAPETGLYTVAGRRARRILDVTPPDAETDDAFWPLLGWIAGGLSPDRIPLLRGLETLRATPDDLKALCAAFGTTSGAPMLHVAGHTPEADLDPAPEADARRIGAAEIAGAWAAFNTGTGRVDLVAVGSPHVSQDEARRIAALFGTRRCNPGTAMIVTIGRDILARLRGDGTLARLEAAGVRVIPDLCWCSITEPVFPPAARVLMTNSGKYVHYAHALSGRAVRFGSLAECVDAAVTGAAPETPPDWARGP